MYTNLISVSQFENVQSNCLLLDCRSMLGHPEWGRDQYLKGHVPGAIYASLDEDLAAPAGLGGRHPLPEQTQWLKTLGRWGLQSNQQVVAYDDAGGAYAARAWWMLRWIGHAATAVLDGGWQAWLEHSNVSRENLDAYHINRGALQTAMHDRIRSNVEFEARPNIVASQVAAQPCLVEQISTQDLQDQIQSRRLQNRLIDARSMPRWAGQEEPIDAIAGHIPGAECLPFQANLDDHGKFLSQTKLKQRFENNEPNNLPPICYCGSGVTAAHNILAMHVAGITDAQLYVGSWSGWITDPKRPIARADID